MPSILNATTSSGLVTSADNSGSLQLATNNGTTAVTISTGQNVGIGTTSPSTRLEIGNPSDANQALRFDFSDSSTARINSTRLAGGNLQSLLLAGQDTVQVQTNGTERMRIRSDGGVLSQPTGGGTLLEQFGCRAWVNFNGTGTVAIRASGNVSSITDNGTGDYLVNLTTAMPDTNYCVCSSVSQDNTVNQYNTFTSQLRTDSTTSAVRILTGYNPSAPVALDCVIVAVAVFR